jgi:hypothetical protein
MSDTAPAIPHTLYNYSLLLSALSNLTTDGKISHNKIALFNTLPLFKDDSTATTDDDTVASKAFFDNLQLRILHSKPDYSTDKGPDYSTDKGPDYTTTNSINTSTPSTPSTP